MNRNLNMEEIQPQRSAEEFQHILRQEFHNKFIDLKTGLVKDHFLYERLCPICHGSEYKKLFVKSGLNHVQCNKCDFVLISPYIKPEEKEKYYRDSVAINNFFMDIVIKTRKERLKSIWPDRIRFVKDFVSDGKVLDVGCGTGEFMEALSNCGFADISGIEPNKMAFDYAEKRFHQKVKNNTFENTNINNNEFDVISFWEVFGHFNHPDKIVKKAHSLLSSNGFVFASMANYCGFEYQVLGKHFDDVYFNVSNYFSIKTIGKLFENNGFKILKIMTPGRLDVQHVRRSILQNPDNIEMCSFLKEIVLDESESGQIKREDLQVYLRKHNLSGSMLIIAIKE